MSNISYTSFTLYLRGFYHEYLPLNILANNHFEPQSIKNTLYLVLLYLKTHHNLDFDNQEQWYEYLLNIENQKFLYFIIYLVEKEEKFRFQVHDVEFSNITDSRWFL